MSATVTDRSNVAGNGPTWQSVVTGVCAVLTIVLTFLGGLIAWTFTSNIADLKASLHEQGEKVDVVRLDIAAARLELTGKIDNVARDVAVLQTKVDHVNSSLGAMGYVPPKQSPPELPKPKP